MSYRLFDANTNHELITNAFASERLRHHLNLHRSYDDPIQRVVIAMAKGTYIPPHYHECKNQWESFSIIEGDVSVLIFDSIGTVTDKINLGRHSDIYGIELEYGTIHTIYCASEHALIMEIKEGPFNPEQAKVIPCWSPDENYNTYPRKTIINVLESIEIGECFPSSLSSYLL
ncbi:WbuC family cupin fold metalloprotein [Lelliottia nimipressuralis]|jgi:cupin fold WbuC family metalloprotein|uniref:WbuC family cupin fold metalloprotein n=1 Tax=Lelliottia nimipressuralis TaxID=69220 RepID=UPI003D2D6383